MVLFLMNRGSQCNVYGGPQGQIRHDNLFHVTSSKVLNMTTKILVTTGEILVRTGKILAMTGKILVTTGEILVRTGKILAMTGKILVTTGKILLRTGKILVTTGEILVTTVKFPLWQTASLLGKASLACHVKDCGCGVLFVVTGHRKCQFHIFYNMFTSI